MTANLPPNPPPGGPAPSGPIPDPPRPTIRVNILWAGGLTTAVVGALVALVGVLICQGVLSINLIHPGLPGNPHAPNWLTYSLSAFLLAVVCTGLLHLLLTLVPTPLQFFNWIMGLLTVIATALPFVDGASAHSLVTAIVDFLTVLSIWLLLNGIAARARQPLATPQARPAGPDPMGPTA